MRKRNGQIAITQMEPIALTVGGQVTISPSEGLEVTPVALGSRIFPRAAFTMAVSSSGLGSQWYRSRRRFSATLCGAKESVRASALD